MLKYLFLGINTHGAIKKDNENDNHLRFCRYHSLFEMTPRRGI